LFCGSFDYFEESVDHNHGATNHTPEGWNNYEQDDPVWDWRLS